MNRKISILICLIIGIACLFVFSSCEEAEMSSSIESSTSEENSSSSSDESTDKSEETKKYAVTFDSNGGSSVETQYIELNKRAKEPPIPTRKGYTFDGWYAGTEKWTFLVYTILEDITLVAKWMPNVNEIIFNANGGEGSMSNMTIETDSSANLTTNKFTKAGYTFKGWSTTENGGVEYVDGASYTMGTNNSYILYAVWQANENALVFDANGGTGTMPNMTIATDTSANLTNNTFTKSGYTFKGWSTAKNGEVEYADGVNYTMGTNISYILYAMWEPIRYNITYALNSGTNDSQNPETYTIEQAIIFKNPTRAGYTFDGWYSDSSFNNNVIGISLGTTENKTLYAKWTANENTLIFSANGGTGTMENMTIATGSSVSLVSNAFARAGYTFKGWSSTTDGEVEYTDEASYIIGVESQYTLYAIWEANKNILVFDANGGVGRMMNMVIATDSTETLRANNFTKEGYEFKGWSTSSNGTILYQDGSSYKMDAKSENTLYAVWETVVYHITYNWNDETETVSVFDFTVEDFPILLDYSLNRDGYGFAGWFNKNFETEILEINSIGNLEVYAKWVPNNNFITFKSNGASGTMLDVEVATGKQITLPQNAFTKTGYEFVGWSSTENGSVEYTDGADYIMGVKNRVELYAVWKAIEYDIIYNMSLENVDNTLNPSTYTIEDIFWLYDPTLKYYDFLGWFTDANFENEILKIENNTGTIVLYAKWAISDDAFRFVEIEDGYSVEYFYADIKEVVIPSTYKGLPVVSIGTSVFRNNTTLTSVIMPNTIKAIDNYAFYGCASLENVTLPISLTSIGSYAFSECALLTSVEIPNNVNLIGYGAFQNCISLDSITIGEGVLTIEKSAFSDCVSVTKINFHAVKMNDLPSDAYNYIFCNVGKSKEGIRVIIGKNVTRVPNELFYSHVNYTPKILSVEFENGSICESIGNRAFCYCTSLESVTIPSGITSIGDSAFFMCSSMKTVINESSLNIVKGENTYGYVAAWADEVINKSEESNG